MCKKQIILAGTGGQGIILMGIILANAALFDGKYVIQTQNYGPESRGGASRADVIISNEEIYHPRVINADIFLALNQESFNKYKGYADENTILIVDSLVNTGEYKSRSFNIVEHTYNVIKKPMTINMVALGVINGLTGIVSNASMEKAIEKSVPKGTIDINHFAYTQGYVLLKNK